MVVYWRVRVLFPLAAVFSPEISKGQPSSAWYVSCHIMLPSGNLLHMLHSYGKTPLFNSYINHHKSSKWEMVSIAMLNIQRVMLFQPYLP